MKKINIVIPTYNRPFYLKRILEYYRLDKDKYQFIIADSSDKKRYEENKKIIKSFSDYDIIYPKNYPSDMNMFFELADALHYATLDYTIICADDDFITSKGIDESIDFLEKNQDYSCAHGQYISFYTKTDDKGLKQFFWQPSYISDSIESEKPEERLYTHMSEYKVATFYAAHKTKDLQMLFDETIKYTDTEDDGQFGEILPSMLTLIHGKMKRLDSLYCAREALPTSAGRTSKKFSDFVSEGTYNSKYSRFKTCLLNHLTQISEIQQKKASRIIDKAWQEYTKNYHGFITPKISYMINKMPISKNLNTNVRETYRKIFRSNIKKDIKSGGSTKDPIDNYLDEFNKIKTYALQSLDE